MVDVALGGARGTLPALPFLRPTQFPTHTPVDGTARSRGARPAGLVMYATAVALVVVNDRFRGVEAALIRPLAALLTGRHGSVSAGSIVYFALGTPRAFGLQVTDECTSALLLIPLLGMMGSFALFTRIALRRQLLALLIGAVLIVGVNVVRVSGIAWATWRFGYDPGYTLSHVFVGSAFSLIGFVGAMLTALWVLVRAERTPRSAAVLPVQSMASVVARPRPKPGPGVVRRSSDAGSGARRPRPGTAVRVDPTCRTGRSDRSGR